MSFHFWIHPKRIICIEFTFIIQIPFNLLLVNYHGIEQYKSITKNSVSCNLLEAAIRYHIKDPKGANIIFATAIPNLLKLKNIEEFTEPDIKALKLGVILSAQILSKRDGGNSNACKILDKASIWFEGDQEFVSLYEEKFNSCKTD